MVDDVGSNLEKTDDLVKDGGEEEEEGHMKRQHERTSRGRVIFKKEVG